MKRQKRKSKSANKHNRSQQQPAEGDTPTRRDFLRKARNGAIATLAVGGGGWFMVDQVRATIREQDLSRIGNGIPTVVQIHDPQCRQCVALQKEARDAVCNFDGELQFVVANIRSLEGGQLAAAHGVGHVTLLLFDGAGQRRAVLSGPNTSEYLTDAFRLHIARHGNS